MENLKDILQLTVSEKLLLLEKTWDSINTDEVEIPDAQKRELDSRLKKLESGEMEFSTWEDARARIRAQMS